MEVKVKNKTGSVHVYHVGIAIHAFSGCCTQSGTHQSGSMKKIQVKHDLGNRLNGGQGQNKNNSAHLHYVGIAMDA